MADEVAPAPVPVSAPENLTLTPAEATERLQKMQDALHPPPPANPTDAQGARAPLDRLIADKTWAAALVAGDPQVNKQFTDLNKLVADGDETGDAIVGIVDESGPTFEFTTGGQLPRRDVATAVADFRAAGLDDAAIGQAMNGAVVSAAEFRAAQALQAARHSDPAWRERFLAGDYQAKREQLLLSIVLSSRVEI
jgi:hypothetical protein